MLIKRNSSNLAVNREPQKDEIRRFIYDVEEELYEEFSLCLLNY